jgi:coproporphyrinogen III oxidase-like Fe-S oxidoreductase
VHNSSSKLDNPFLDEKCYFCVFYNSLNSSKCDKMAAWAFRG